jgi:hypothetical protein
MRQSDVTPLRGSRRGSAHWCRGLGKASVVSVGTAHSRSACGGSDGCDVPDVVKALSVPHPLPRSRPDIVCAWHPRGDSALWPRQRSGQQGAVLPGSLVRPICGGSKGSLHHPPRPSADQAPIKRRSSADQAPIKRRSSADQAPIKRRPRSSCPGGDLGCTCSLSRARPSGSTPDQEAQAKFIVSKRCHRRGSNPRVREHTRS